MIRTGGAKGAFASSVHRPGRGFDVWLLVSAAILLFIGLAAIHSVDITRTNGGGLMIKQMLWAAIGLVLYLACASVSQRVLERAAPVLYVLGVLSLIGVKLFGVERNGAKRWLDFGPMQFQPSEFAKVVLIITLAVYFSKRWEGRTELRTYVGSLLHAAPFLILVLLQPHLAGSVSFGMIWLAVSLCAGVPWKFVAATVAIVVCFAGIALATPGLVPDYMKARIIGISSKRDENST